MMHLEDFLVVKQLNDIEDIMYNDQIDEGKIKNGIKKIWDFITGKKKKKKVKPAGSGAVKSKSKNIEIEKLTWDEIRQSIKIDDQMKRAKERSGDSKVEIAGMKDDNEIIALMAYMTRSGIEGYQECPYILALQIDPDHQGQGYLRQLVETIYDICKKNGQKYILVSNAEYESKKYWADAKFDGTIEDPKDKDKAQAHYGEPGKIVNYVKS